MSGRAQVYNVGVTHQGTADVVSLESPAGGTAQISLLPEPYGDGFLIRVWRPGSTYEQGGDNDENISLSVVFNQETGDVELKHMRVSATKLGEK